MLYFQGDHYFERAKKQGKTELYLHTSNTGMTRRDGMGRGAGGGFRMGTRVNPWLIHINVWQKPLQ